MDIRTTPRRRLRLGRRPSPSKGESFIAEYAFPPHIEPGVRRRNPGLTDAGWAAVEGGLRDWLICCAWRGGATLAMPSRVVDEAWHQFILDSASYMTFCEHAYGEYLHHIPEGDDALEGADGRVQVVHAWDRSAAAQRRGESGIWDLDDRLGIERPLGIAAEFRRAVRARYQPAGGGQPGTWNDSGFGDGGDGAGCGGGGCGGGGCGGGGS